MSNNYNEHIDQLNMSFKDARDVDILTTQSNAQLVLALGYLLEYTASMQALELIYLKYARIEYDNNINEESENDDRNENQWINEGIDADKTALLAAELELYGQTILARLDYIKLQYLSDNYDQKDLTQAKTANIEIYIGAMLEEIAYIFNLQGARLLYNISNENAVYD